MSEDISGKRLSKGYVQVYTGDGKGKTTACLGLALRAAGHGMRTYIGQFMKGQHYGELEALRDYPLITVEQYGDVRCIRREEVTPEHVAQARRGLERAREAMLSGQYEIVVLDEPTANLDPAGRRELDEVLDGVAHTMLLVTHDLPYALQLCDRALIINRGTIVADGPTREILADREVMAANRLELPHGFDPTSV